MSIYDHDETRFCFQIKHRTGYSTVTFTFPPQSVDNLPTPTPILIKVFHNLYNNETVITYNKILSNKAGIHCFINTVNDKRCIASAKGLYVRLTEHLANKKCKTTLQSYILKFALYKLDFCVYEYFTSHSKIVSNKTLTDLDTSYIK